MNRPCLRCLDATMHLVDTDYREVLTEKEILDEFGYSHGFEEAYISVTILVYECERGHEVRVEEYPSGYEGYFTTQDVARDEL
jgi:hypothetical protein